MRVTLRTVEWVSFGLAFLLLFLTIRWIALWSLGAAAWLSATAAMLIPDLSGNAIQAMLKLMAVIFMFGAMFAITEATKWVVRRCVSHGPDGRSI